MEAENNIRLIRIKEVMSKTGIARSTVWYMVKKGTFPIPRKYLHELLYGLSLKLIHL